ncbi:hypothetical protein [Streptosporangium roseum]|uniref:hypothetical protein n=1 Tax=Streptosporangium roseum TaxID=2001 RepID=UPI003325C751
MRPLCREEVVAAAREEVHRRVTRFQQLAGEVPAMCHHLVLAGSQRAAVDTCVEVMAAWTRGYLRAFEHGLKRGAGPY